jgi:hypothetical protein
MRNPNKRWRNLFLFCLGVTVATVFIMQWLETDFWVNDEKFSKPGLELFYSKREIITVLSQIKPPAKTALNYDLIFDFVFMAGVYPGIAALCMMAREKPGRKSIQTALFALAILQPVAWIFDVAGNCYLLKWMDKPAIGDEFGIYHNLILIKWVISIAGLFLPITVFVFGSKLKDR